MSVHSKGFTLIELMIVIAIIGVLAAIAYPSYERYIVKSNRTDIMAEMQQIAVRIEANKINYRRYDRIPLTSLFSSTPNSDGEADFPATGTALYTVTATPNDKTNLSDEKWSIEATPKTTQRMKDDGTLTLDYQGIKCRNVGTTIKACGANDEWNK